MNNAILNFPVPANEPVKAYLEGSPERIALDAELDRQPTPRSLVVGLQQHHVHTDTVAQLETVHLRNRQPRTRSILLVQRTLRQQRQRPHKEHYYQQ